MFMYCRMPIEKWKWVNNRLTPLRPVLEKEYFSKSMISTFIKHAFTIFSQKKSLSSNFDAVRALIGFQKTEGVKTCSQLCPYFPLCENQNRHVPSGVNKKETALAQMAYRHRFIGKVLSKTHCSYLLIIEGQIAGYQNRFEETFPFICSVRSVMNQRNIANLLIVAIAVF